MSLRYDTVTFLSDYGTEDEFVGVVHSVLRSIAPGVTVVDLTHQIPPYDTRAAGLLLARSVQYLNPGVVLAVVDPGVGTDRRPVAVEVGDGESVLVGPDNGVLAPAVAMCGGATRAVVLDDPAYHLPAPGRTFDGRDVFGPAAAHLCAGVPLEDLGTAVDPATLLPGVLPVPRHEDGELVCEVLWVDRFGNAQLNIGPDDLEPLGDRIRLRFADTVRTAGRVGAFGEVGAGEIGLVIDSYGLVAVTLDRLSAAAELGLLPSTEVLVSAADDGAGAGGPPTGVTSPVRLTPTLDRPAADRPGGPGATS